MARKMKDSGIEWIGEIPEGWEVVPVRSCFDEVRTKNTDGQEQNALQFKSGNIISKANFNVNIDDYVADTITNYTVVLPDTVMINGLNLNYDFKSLRVALVKEKGVITSAYLAIFPDRKKIFPQYATYLFKGYETKMAVHNMGAGIRKTLGYKEFKNQPLLLPSKEDQNKISAYLDSKCSRIDIMLFKIRSSIEEYKKLKQAVITQAVTKGVRGEREMKDSGVEWIGAIPKDWEIKRLKSFCTIVDCKNRTPDVFPDGKYTVVRTTCIKDCSFSYEGSYQTDTTNFKAWTLKGQPHKGDIFFTREAPVGEACLVPNADNLCMGQRVMFFRPEDNSDARYIMYSIYGPLVREYIASKNSGSTVGHLKLGQVACIPIFYCPPLEQKEIADYLDAKCAEIDGLIAKKEQLAKELESYKKSLIYEVVTGKREV